MKILGFEIGTKKVEENVDNEILTAVEASDKRIEIRSAINNKNFKDAEKLLAELEEKQENTEGNTRRFNDIRKSLVLAEKKEEELEETNIKFNEILEEVGPGKEINAFEISDTEEKLTKALDKYMNLDGVTEEQLNGVIKKISSLEQTNVFHEFTLNEYKDKIVKLSEKIISGKNTNNNGIDDYPAIRNLKF